MPCPQNHQFGCFTLHKHTGLAIVQFYPPDRGYHTSDLHITGHGRRIGFHAVADNFQYVFTLAEFAIKAIGAIGIPCRMLAEIIADFFTV